MIAKIVTLTATGLRICFQQWRFNCKNFLKIIPQIPGF